MSTPRVRFIVYRPSHHSPHSGYSRTAEYGLSQFDSHIIKANPLPPSIIRNRIMWWLANGVIAYNRISMAAEIKTAWEILKSSRCIYHILYGEILYHYLGFFNNFRDNRLVATFHQPPSEFERVVKIKWHLQQLSAVICVGRTQQEYFKNILPPERVFFVPLGVDTEFYTPPASFDARDPNLCLFVGQHFRDFPTLRGVIELVAFRRPKTRFVAITSAEGAKRVGQHPNLELMSGISESDLFDLYQTASLMVMPLQDATANNGLLEALACGLPLVITDIGSTRDYVTPECAVFVPPQDSQKMTEEVLRLLDNRNLGRALSQKSRQQAIKFSWPKVIKQLQTVYEEVS